MKVKEESKNWLKAQHSENEDHGIWSHHFMANRWRNKGNSGRFYILGAPKSLQIVTAAMKLKDISFWKKSYDQPRQHIEKQRYYFPKKGPDHLVKAIVFPVVMYGCESWTVKKAERQRIDASELWC